MAAAKVRGCQVSECVYNVDGLCHAVAITVGDENCPKCETFNSFYNVGRGKDTGRIAEVGACKASSCIFNVGRKCQSEGIKVDCIDTGPQCLTFQPRCIAGILTEAFHTRRPAVDAESALPEMFVG